MTEGEAAELDALPVSKERGSRQIRTQSAPLHKLLLATEGLRGEIADIRHGLATSYTKTEAIASHADSQQRHRFLMMITIIRPMLHAMVSGHHEDVAWLQIAHYDRKASVYFFDAPQCSFDKPSMSPDSIGIDKIGKDRGAIRTSFPLGSLESHDRAMQ